VTAPDDDRLTHRLSLSNMRQELLTPVSAIVGYSEILHEDAVRQGLEDMTPDLERILSAARGLFDSVNRLLDPEHAQELFEGDDTGAVQQKLRHDLRTPINAVTGYGEMLLEDLAEFGAEGLRPDFEKLLTEARGLLTHLDAIIDFSRSDSDTRTAHTAADGAADMISSLVQSLKPIEDERAAVEPGHILVVDDIETNRDLLSRRLVGFGHSVSTANGGRQALAKMEAEDFDLILLDLMMPDMNGFEVLARLKADARMHRVPVIMISALDEIDSVIRCIEAGAEDYLPKPFNPVLLRARINACLDKKRFRDREQVYLDRLEEEMAKHERLLLNILPKQIVGRLNDGETVIADRFDDVSVLFSDIVDFTRISSDMAPDRLVSYLNRLFSEFDAVARESGVEKIKMIGDAYMAVAGAPDPRPDHAAAIVRMALGMIDALALVNADTGLEFGVRIGIHSGPVVAGIIGTHRFLYDVWGDTVNVASRLEATSLAGRIQISAATAKLLAESFELEPRGRIPIKGRGELETFFVAGAREVAPAAARP
jgi:class 3 adenylate cyclase